jgi:hypothetical protein
VTPIDRMHVIPSASGRWGDTTRQQHRVPPRPLRAGMARVALAVAVVTFVATVVVADDATAHRAPSVTADPIRLAPGERLRVYVAGDSNAFILGLAMRWWGEDNGIDVAVSGWFGCAVVTGGEFRYTHVQGVTSAKCDAWVADRTMEIERFKPHVVVVLHGLGDVLDRKLPGSGVWQHIGMPDYDAVARAGIERMTDLFLDHHARVLWVAYPHVRTGILDGVPPARDHPESDPMRMDRWNTIARQVVARRPGAQMLELGRHMRRWPDGELDQDFRLDGIHPNPDVVDDLAGWMGQQVVRLLYEIP